jgi:hypothetical protein
VSDALDRIAAALERLVRIEEAREARGSRRRRGDATPADAPAIDELAMRRAAAALDAAGLGPGRKARGRRGR